MGRFFSADRTRRLFACPLALSLLVALFAGSAPSLPDPDAFSRSTPAPQPELAPPAPASPLVTTRPKQPHAADSALHAAILTPTLAVEPPRAHVHSRDTAAPTPLPAQTVPDQPRAPPAC